ncbi:sensor histidine kinase [Microbacterium sp. NPDC019599]|uniref:sensor histidine kinase n=1 Tax=Microbacterium sp. NPDC019599 TaxID=3154690 RepID=UPI0033EA6E7E
MARSVFGGLLRPAAFGSGDDPDAAPWALGPSTDLPFRWHRARTNLLWTYLGGIVFLVFAIPTIAEGVDAVGLGLRIGFLVVLAAAYVGAAWTADSPLLVRWCYVAGFTGFVVLGGALLWGCEFALFGIYPAALTATLIPWRHARFALVVWALALSLAGVLGGSWMPVLFAALSLGIGLGMAGVMESIRIRRMLERSQTRIETLTVAAERERISRDLHDILGHSLTAITIKSSLAARLADTKPAAAKEQMVAVEAIARQALADVRATVSGLTEIRLATEIASARSVLLAAGVEARTPVALPTLPDGISELFGYVVRESVTNVVRHAQATSCAIEVDEHSVEVRDDGVGVRADRSGHGLSGLGERVTAAGGILEVAAVPGGGTSVRASLASSPEPVRSER